MNITVIVNACTAFVIAGGGCILAALVATKGESPSTGVIIMAVVTGLVSAAKDVRSLLKLPPLPEATDKPSNP